MKRILPVLLIMLNIGAAVSQGWKTIPVEPKEIREKPKTFSITGGIGYPITIGENNDNAKLSFNFGIDYLIDNKSLLMAGVRYYGINRSVDYSKSDGTSDNVTIHTEKYLSNLFEFHVRLPFKLFTFAVGPVLSYEELFSESIINVGGAATIGALIKFNETFHIDAGVTVTVLKRTLAYPYINVRFML